MTVKAADRGNRIRIAFQKHLCPSSESEAHGIKMEILHHLFLSPFPYQMKNDIFTFLTLRWCVTRTILVIPVIYACSHRIVKLVQNSLRRFHNYIVNKLLWICRVCELTLSFKKPSTRSETSYREKVLLNHGKLLSCHQRKLQLKTVHVEYVVYIMIDHSPFLWNALHIFTNY